MRSRIMSAFVAAAAAGATATTLGLAAAGAANAAVTTKAKPSMMGSTIGSTSSAGYEASGRYFRYISSTITVPDTSFLTGDLPAGVHPALQRVADPAHRRRRPVHPGRDRVVRGGPVVRGHSARTGTWVAFVEAFNNSLSGPYFSHFYNLAGVNQGDGVNFSIYYYQGGNELHFVITPPLTSGTPQFYKTRAYGPIYDHAAALDDFTDSTGTPIPLPFFLHSFRINQFLQGALTTYSGAKGSFVGPWTTSKVIATSNGLLPPSGTTRVSPSALWSDGLSANGAVRANDAFGVWAR